ncbi:MAG: SDR family oxidoreductase [Spirochaetia bacterium]|jgi:NAD(P)-dependent dehydrogenase (short-subunit alcohol dehydrogenase family)
MLISGRTSLAQRLREVPSHDLSRNTSLDLAPDKTEEKRHWRPVARVGAPEDVVKAALYLASDDSELMTASMHVLDGGLTAQEEGISPPEKGGAWARKCFLKGVCLGF